MSAIRKPFKSYRVHLEDRVNQLVEEKVAFKEQIAIRDSRIISLKATITWLRKKIDHFMQYWIRPEHARWIPTCTVCGQKGHRCNMQECPRYSEWH